MKIIRKIPFEVYFSIIWCISVLLVNPKGNFPLNDDWAFSQSVWNLYQQGKLTMSEWPAMTLVAQVIWGTLFCKVLGLSFVSLRISTLITGFLGIITFYKIAGKISNNKNIAIFSSLILFFNPLFFSLSFTFMTDVHFLSFLLFSLFFFFRYLENEKVVDFIFAIVFSVVSTMIRQPGIILPLGFALTLLYKNKRKVNIVIAFTPFLITLISLILHSIWLKNLLNYPKKVTGINEMMNLIFSIDSIQMFIRFSKTVLHTGLFLLPLLILYWKIIRRNFLKSKVRSIVVILPIVIILFIGGAHFPEKNVLYNLGLGPKVMKDTYWNINLSPQLNEQLWIVIMKVLSISGIIMFILTISFNKYKKESQGRNIGYCESLRIFLLIISVEYMILLLINNTYFDRYSIPLVCFASLYIISIKIEFSNILRYTTFGFIALMIFFSVSATRDYLSWNRARWEAANYLTNDMKISPKKIDGGFEFNGWYNAGPYNPIKRNEKSWWFVTDDEYVISFGSMDGYKQIKSYYYPQILSLSDDSIYILKRQLK